MNILADPDRVAGLDLEFLDGPERARGGRAKVVAARPAATTTPSACTRRPQRPCPGRFRRAGRRVRASPRAALAWGWVRNRAPVRSAPRRSASRRSAPRRSAVRRSAPRRSAAIRYARADPRAAGRVAEQPHQVGAAVPCGPSSLASAASARAKALVQQEFADRRAGGPGRRRQGRGRAGSAPRPRRVRVAGRRAAGARPEAGIGQVPQQFVQQPHRRERVEHAACGVGVLAPRASGEGDLRHLWPAPKHSKTVQPEKPRSRRCACVCTPQRSSASRLRRAPRACRGRSPPAGERQRDAAQRSTAQSARRSWSSTGVLRGKSRVRDAELTADILPRTSRLQARGRTALVRPRGFLSRHPQNSPRRYSPTTAAPPRPMLSFSADLGARRPAGESASPRSCHVISAALREAGRPERVAPGDQASPDGLTTHLPPYVVAPSVDEFPRPRRPRPYRALRR